MREKMLNGELYNPGDIELTKEREIAKNICYEYNHTKPDILTKDKKKELLEQLFDQKINAYINIEPELHVDYGRYTKIGKCFYANYNLCLLDAGGIEFGDRIVIGPNCSFYTSNHPIDKELRASGYESANKIVVGNDVWFGGNVVVLGGVHIGNNCVIGAGSVVTKDVPDDSIVAGNPASVIKSIKKDA